MADLIIALLCLPLIGVGTLLAIFGDAFNKKRLKPKARRLQRASVIVICVSGAIASLLGNSSAATMASYDATKFALGCVMLAYGGSLTVSHLRLGPVVAKLQLLGPVVAFLAGVLIASFSANEFIGDFLLPRDFIDGTVIQTSLVSGYRSSTKYYIQIDGRQYTTTAEVYGRFHIGDRIHAEIGVGSNMVLHATPL